MTISYWFINTDAAAIRDGRTYDLWFMHGMAFSGGDRERYGLPLRSLRPSDILLMYHNGTGIVGVGRVLEPWDGKPYSSKLLYSNWDLSEYRVRVDWYIDLRDNPADPRSEFACIPRKFLRPIIKRRAEAEDFIKRVEMNNEFKSPEEFITQSDLQEGKSRTVPVDVYERNPIARKQCIGHWGAICQVCGFAFQTFYGPVGQDYIHVHHLAPLKLTKGAHSVNPTKDLRPVCANCHAIIHKKDPPYSIEQVAGFIKNQRRANRRLHQT